MSLTTARQWLDTLRPGSHGFHLEISSGMPPSVFSTVMANATTQPGKERGARRGSHAGAGLEGNDAESLKSNGTRGGEQGMAWHGRAWPSMAEHGIIR